LLFERRLDVRGGFRVDTKISDNTVVQGLIDIIIVIGTVILFIVAIPIIFGGLILAFCLSITPDK
jgi:hypothetical protein